jgi:AraC family transcriptional regulator
VRLIDAMCIYNAAGTNGITEYAVQGGNRIDKIRRPVMNKLVADQAGALPSIVQFTPPDLARRHMAAWNGIRTDVVQVVRREPFEYGAKTHQHLLIMSERAERYDGETIVEGLPTSTLHEFSRKLSLVPADHRFFGWQNPRMLTRVTYFYIDPLGPLIDPELHFAETEFKPRLFFFDKDLWETATKLKAQSETTGPGQRQYVEALSIVLAHELLHLNNGTVPVTQYVRGGLSGWREKKVAQFIEDHLSDDISLATLAEVAGLSPFHFVRAFKQSFGVPPHRYMSRLRMEQAKSLLADPALSVTQIGFRLGFSNTSSFTTTFHKSAGLTPTAYRRSLE